MYEFPKDLEAFSYLKPFTCEWLKCPNFAMSEMADSIIANLNILADSVAEGYKMEKLSG